MSARYDCMDAAQRAMGVTEATAALRKGELAVLPTDTVYGVAADAFSPVAVAALLSAKGRGRHAPPPVLVGSVRAALALVEDVSSSAKDLIDEFWPGGLTLVFRANRTLLWDLGDTKGTVAVRMPLHPIALEVLREAGPLAVSSANRSGEPPAITAADAQAQLGDAVAVYLDGGTCPGSIPSTIVDVTGPLPRLLRRGVIGVDRLRDVVALIAGEDFTDAAGEDAAGEDAAGEEVPAGDGAGEEVPAGDGAGEEVPAGGGAGEEVPAGGAAGEGAPAGGAAEAGPERPGGA